MGIHIHHEIKDCPKCGGDISTEENGNHRFTITCGRCFVSKEVDLDWIPFEISKYLYEELFENKE